MYRCATFGLCQIIGLLTAGALAQILTVKPMKVSIDTQTLAPSGLGIEIGICFQSALPMMPSV
jgi:hypothetical protein